MRAFLPILFFLSTPLFSYCQDSTIILSRFETFSRQAGKILKTQTKTIGEVGNLTIEKVKTTDAFSRDAATAIKMSQ